MTTYRSFCPSPRWGLTLAAMTMLLSACATTGTDNNGATTARVPHPADPYERFNRSMFAVNEALDQTLVKPVAQGYEAAVPLPLRVSVSNFFGNVADPMIGVNNLAQGKPRQAGSDVLRLLVNSTLGIFGLFDVASEMGLDKHNEDIGQTLAVWGVGPGPYFFWPVIGPRTLRDTAGYAADSQFDPLWQIRADTVRYTATGARIIDLRASLLPAESVLNQAVVDDKYTYLRAAYLQRRRSQIYDGDPPREPEPEDPAPATQPETPAAASPTPSAN